MRASCQPTFQKYLLEFSHIMDVSGSYEVGIQKFKSHFNSFFENN